MSPRLSQRSLGALLEALCLDYDRRRIAIAQGRLSRRVLHEYRYLNDRILYAAYSVTGDTSLSHIYIREIGERIGYAYTELEGVSEITYKRRKALIRRRILEELRLLDPEDATPLC